jgi:hypothetical protein
MSDAISALIPSAVVAAAVIYAVVRLVRSEGPGRRAPEPNEKSHEPDPS